jgi:NIMA-interacting peptidyl-prolyl cis-trans isomerase 1
MKKRRNAYKDLDAVQEGDYSCSWTREGSLELLNTSASKQFEWDKLLAEVRSQLGAEVIVPEASINIKVEDMNQNPEERSFDIDISKNQKENEIQYHHMMVKHRFSNRPSSWREKNITRSKEEAVKCIEEYKAQIEKGLNNFEEIATKFSDCSSTKSSEYRQFGSEKIVQLFEDTVRILKVGQISGPIITHEGIHMLERIV